MRFAHIADCHLGAWSSHPDLRELPLRAFAAAVDKIIAGHLDFVLLAGDFFDSSMPSVDVLRFAVEQLMRLKEAGMRVYAIAGSHDYSPTGKTMLSVLEAAGLLYNVHMRCAEDKSGARIFGIEGLRGGLDREQFANLNENNSCFRVEQSSHDKDSSTSPSYDTNSSPSPRARYNIFMFHAAVDEISGMKGVSLAALPKGFDYYAAGHVHEPAQQAYDKGFVVFPGPLFPAEFSELEKLGCGSFCIVDASNGCPSMRTEIVKLADVKIISVDCNLKSPHEIESEFFDLLSKDGIDGSIILLKASGMLASGKPTDINWKRITEAAQQAGARAVKRSVHLTVQEAEVAKVEVSGGLEQIEQSVITKNVERSEDKDIALQLMHALAVEKGEDEKNALYEEKIKVGAMKILGVEA